MSRVVALVCMAVLVVMVAARVQMLRRRGISAFKFGQIDRTDYLIPPVMLWYFAMLLGSTFGWPYLAVTPMFGGALARWAGVAFCLAGVGLMFWSLVSFRDSFRVGIDETAPDALITSGVFAFSRNPIYVAFGCMLFGQFLVFGGWPFLAYFLGGVLLFQRQVLREEAFLKQHYGEEYTRYCQKTRRYL